jgi:hypothetical protein
MAEAYLARRDQIGQVGLAVERALFDDLATFNDAKALLLTRVAFVPSVTSTSPPPGTLARASFTRQIRPDAVAAKAKIEGGKQQVDVMLGWKQLVAAGSAVSTPAHSRMAYLEVLDDARYDNAFEVRRAGQQFECFESMVDGAEKTKPSTGVDASVLTQDWTARPPLVPALAENAQVSDDPRELRLASRNILSPPELLWSGIQSELGTALAAVAIGQGQGWTAERLSGGAGPQPGLANLAVAAYRRADAWNTKLTVDRRLTHFVYRIRGDEEGTIGSVIDAFENDGFFIRAMRNHEGDQRALDSNKAGPPALAAGTEHALREFLEVNRGTAAAATLADRTLLNNLALYEQLEGLVFTETAPALRDDAVLLRPRDVGNANGNICLGAQASGTAFLERVRNVVLFTPVIAAGESAGIATAYLAVSVALDVWSGWDLSLTQSRNMPFEQWSVPCSTASGRRAAPFARIFWQATEQASMPTTQHITGGVANQARHWDAAPAVHRVFRIPQSWIGVAVPARAVMERLLFHSKLWVGEHDGDTLLNADIAELVFGTPFSITVYQEQFLQRNGPPQLVRHAFPSFVSVAQGQADQSRVWFAEEYATFSIDIRWFRPRGTVFLAIERIFAQAP